LAVGLAAQAAAQDGLAFQRAQHLRRGVNLSMWYAQDRQLYDANGGADKLAAYITPADFKLVKDLGCDHVRLSIDPGPLLDNEATGAFRPEAMARLDETVKQITATGLVVVLDLHPEEGWKQMVIRTDDGAVKLLAFWKSFAKHFAATDPAQVYFEVLNEPDGVEAQQWTAEEARAVTVIRAQAPQHTIIATGVYWGGIDGLLAMEPFPDGNVVYSFHDYEPMTFTHQGATWTGEQFVPLRGVPYPSSPEKVAALAAGLTDAGAQKALTEYGQKRWDQAHMAARIGLAVAWAKAHQVPLWCGEFGVYKTFALPADRARWIADMRRTMEDDGIGWDMWDYRGGFALVDEKDGVAVPDPAIVKALGLGGR
jgi:hypothetical protein